VDGFVERTPSARFVGRADGVCDLVGEKLSEAFVGDAIDRWLAGSRCRASFAMLAPAGGGSTAGYVLYIETNTRPSPPIEELDRLLRANPHYDWARQRGQLSPLRVFEVGANAYERYSGNLAARGMRLGDIKPTHLSTSDHWTEAFGR